MNSHFLIGGGDFSKEIISFEKYVNEDGFKLKILKISKNFNSQTIKKLFNRFEKSSFTITIGNPILRKKIYDLIKLNSNLINSKIVFKNTIVSNNFSIGNGSIIMSNVLLSNNVKVGKNCHIHPNAVIGHDVIIGDYCNIGANVFIAGNCKIENNCIINSNSVLIKNVSIKKDCVVGSGSVVLNNISKNSHVFGLPAKKIF
jgi:sugar O-acyltransferase (sialic acid O-acetyltransferase NeuD family)